MDTEALSELTNSGSLRYSVRSERLMDLMGDLKSGKLELRPYFQRKLVWRISHKKDFIETILKGYPFPEIFIAKGDIDLEKMMSTDCVVDGQQRLNSIKEYLNNEFPVMKHKYDDLSDKEKESFLKYQIAVIDLDLKHDDNLVLDIFQRLNRTFYALSAIEKLSTEFAHAEIMLLAKLLSGELFESESFKEEFSDIEEEYEEKYQNPSSVDPRVPVSFLKWAKDVNVKYVYKLLTESNIFSPYEMSRQVHLMYALNILASIKEGIFTRNVKLNIVQKHSEKYGGKKTVINKLNKVSRKILKLKLRKNSYWYNKANMFSLIYVFYTKHDEVMVLSEAKIKESLETFFKELPEDYRIAAREGVNNKTERLLRHEYIGKIIDSIPTEG